MKFRALALFLCAVLPFAGIADAAAREDILGKAAEGAAICAAEMPDSRAPSSALIAKGFAIVDALGNRDETCLAALSRLSEAEAQQLIEPWLRASRATVPVKGRFTHAWLGTFKGGPIELAITRHTDLHYFTGRAIMARTAMNP